MPAARAAGAGGGDHEFLANNGGGLRDEDLESPGWIELYNSGPGAVNLGGWRLTDDAGNLSKMDLSRDESAGGRLSGGVCFGQESREPRLAAAHEFPTG